MASRLALSERLNKPMKQPKELASWSEVDKQIYFDDRSLRYYYFPRGDIEKRLNLAAGSSGFVGEPLKNNYVDTVLKAVKQYEEKNGRLNVSLITWRGLLTSVISASQQGKVDCDSISLDIVGFDGQIFMCNDYETSRKEFESQNYPDKDKFMYCGFNFERYATLPKPWGECSRSEVEERYRGAYKAGSEYGILIQGGVGPIKVAYGAEVDCSLGAKDPASPLNNYVEIKTSAEIRDRRGAQRFEKKLFKTWLQSFLAGVPMISYGFRGRDFELKSVETYRTTELPTIVKRSRITAPDMMWSGNDAISFYAVFLSWLKDTVEDGKTYKLTWDGKSRALELREEKIVVPGREVSFLLPEFVEWRRSQKSSENA